MADGIKQQGGPEEYCDDCGTKLVPSTEMPCLDPYIGRRYSIEIDQCGYCPHCKEWHLRDPDQMEHRQMEIRGRAALEKYPFSEECWILLEEAASMGLKDPENFQYQMYVVERDGWKYVLKKSVELLLKSSDSYDPSGLFPLSGDLDRNLLALLDEERGGPFQVPPGDRLVEPPEYCFSCGDRLVWTKRMSTDDPYLGRKYEFEVDECQYCPACRAWYIHDFDQKNRRIQEIRGKAALEKYPFSERFWIPLEETASMGLKEPGDFQYQMYVVERDNQKYALRKSVELLLESLAEKDVERTGLFRLED